MKTLVLAIILLSASVSHSQDFKLSTFAGSGVKFDRTQDATLYTASILVIPQFDFGKISVEGISKSIFIDSTTELQAGGRLTYQVWNNDNKSLRASGHYLYGSDNAQILGAGVSYGVNLLRLNLEGSYDTKSQSKYVEFNVGLIIAE